MKINGLESPAAFVRDVQARRFDRPRGSWKLHENLNAWGEFMETELDEVFEDEARMQKETNDLAEDFGALSVEDAEGYAEVCGVSPGEIPYFWDFSKIICFGNAADDAPFCFDFRDNERAPNVIWWADAFWQRVAPSYEAFIELFDIPPVPSAK